MILPLKELLIQIEKNRNNNDFIYYARGSEILQRAVWRITHQDPLHAMSFNINSGIDSIKIVIFQILKEILSHQDFMQKNKLKKLITIKIIDKNAAKSNSNFKQKIKKRKSK